MNFYFREYDYKIGGKIGYNDYIFVYLMIGKMCEFVYRILVEILCNIEMRLE